MQTLDGQQNEDLHMPELVTRYTKGNALSIQELDEHCTEYNLTTAADPFTITQAHNRQHIVLQDGCTAVEFTATATMNTNLDSSSASDKIGFNCKISNNTGVDVTFNSGGVQFNGGTGTYTLPDNASCIIGFDNVSNPKGYFVLADYIPISAINPLSLSLMEKLLVQALVKHKLFLEQ